MKKAIVFLMVVAIFLSNIVAEINETKRGEVTFEFSSDVTAKINLSGSGLSKSELLGATRKGCNKNAGDYSGDYCGALIQRDSWEITDDYPW